MATMSEQISDEFNRLWKRLADFQNALILTERRVSNIEQRQAKLACSETSNNLKDDGGNGTDEQAEWDELAEMLGMESVAWMVGFTNHNYTKGFETDERCERNFKAMLVGLACEECDGSIWEDGGSWHWEHKKGSPYAWYWEHSRPAAAIAMLKAHRRQP